MGTDAATTSATLRMAYTYVLNVAAGVCADADTIVVTVFPRRSPMLARPQHLPTGHHGTGCLTCRPSGSTFIRNR